MDEPHRYPRIVGPLDVRAVENEGASSRVAAARFGVAIRNGGSRHRQLVVGGGLARGRWVHSNGSVGASTAGRRAGNHVDWLRWPNLVEFQ